MKSAIAVLFLTFVVFQLIYGYPEDSQNSSKFIFQLFFSGRILFCLQNRLFCVKLRCQKMFANNHWLQDIVEHLCRDTTMMKKQKLANIFSMEAAKATIIISKLKMNAKNNVCKKRLNSTIHPSSSHRLLIKWTFARTNQMFCFIKNSICVDKK